MPQSSTCCPSGFVGSGPLVILADLVLRIGPQPSFAQRLALYWFVTAVTCAGEPAKPSPLNAKA